MSAVVVFILFVIVPQSDFGADINICSVSVAWG